MDLNTISDRDSYALLRALLSAKFKSEDSDLVGGLPVVNNILEHLLCRNYSDASIQNTMSSYKGLTAQKEWCGAAIKRIKSELLLSEDKSWNNYLDTLLQSYLFPYRVNDEIIEWVLGEIYL